MQSAGWPDRPLLVVVSGAPGSGKTTLATRLSEELGLALVARDHIKEALGDALGLPEDVAASQRLGRAAYAALFALGADTLAVGRGVVLESNFRRGLSESELSRLIAGTEARLIHCTCAPELIERRYRARFDGGTRHPVHRDDERRLALIDDLAVGRFEPLDLDWPVLVVDTTSGYRPDIEEILAFVRANESVRGA